MASGFMGNIRTNVMMGLKREYSSLCSMTLKAGDEIFNTTGGWIKQMAMNKILARVIKGVEKLDTIWSSDKFRLTCKSNGYIGVIIVEVLGSISQSDFAGIRGRVVANWTAG